MGSIYLRRFRSAHSNADLVFAQCLFASQHWNPKRNPAVLSKKGPRSVGKAGTVKVSM